MAQVDRQLVSKWTSATGQRPRTCPADLAGTLVTSSRTPGEPQKRPDDRTSNAGVEVRTADGSRQTADAADDQYLIITKLQFIAIIIQPAVGERSIFTVCVQLQTKIMRILLL